MSTEQRTQITDILKWVAYGAITISSFIISNTYFEMKDDIKEIGTRVQSIESRVIRIEYELKLK